MASLEEATHQRRVFAWQGADTEPLTGTEADSPGAGWTITRDDVVVLIEQLRNAAGAVVAFVELQVDGRRTTHRGWVDPASLKRRPGDETEDELALRREQLADIAGEHLAGREYAEAYHAFGEAIAADPANHLLYGDRALCCARLHKETPSPELRAAGLKDAEMCVELQPTCLRGHERLVTMLALSTEAGEGDHKTLEAAVRRGLRVDAASVSLRRALQDLRDAGVALDTTLAPTDADLADSGKAAAPKTRGAELFARGDFASAADKYRAALAWDPTDPRIWANRAACFSRRGRFDEALRDAEYACRLSPRGARARYRLAEARLGQGRVGDAREACDAGLLLDCDEKLRRDLVALRGRCAVVE
jgi:tetratricopeptide (TPR) repeat protein